MVHLRDRLVNKVHRTLCFSVVAESCLIHVAMQMFVAHVMVNAVVRAFQQSPKAFDTVRMRLIAHVFTNGVIHRAMTETAK